MLQRFYTLFLISEQKKTSRKFQKPLIQQPLHLKRQFYITMSFRNCFVLTRMNCLVYLTFLSKSIFHYILDEVNCTQSQEKASNLIDGETENNLKYFKVVPISVGKVKKQFFYKLK